MGPLIVIYTGTSGARAGGPDPWVPNVTIGGVGMLAAKFLGFRTRRVGGTDSPGFTGRPSLRPRFLAQRSSQSSDSWVFETDCGRKGSLLGLEGREIFGLHSWLLERWGLRSSMRTGLGAPNSRFH